MEQQPDLKIQFISIVNCYKQSVKENNQGKKYIATHKALSTLLQRGRITSASTLPPSKMLRPPHPC